MSGREQLNKIPKLERKICDLTKMDKVTNITSFEVISDDIVLTFTDKFGNEETLSLPIADLNLTGGLQSFTPTIVVDTYNDLASVTGQDLFEFAEVRTSQGTSWLPGTIGGTFYGSGLYYWNGTEWVHDNDKVYEALQQIFTGKADTTHTHTVSDITDFPFIPEELDDLTDVNTQTVFPQPGWLLKYNGTLYVPAMREIVSSTSLQINDFSGAPLDKINQSFNFQRTGTYSITVYFSWSYNSTSTDFRANVTFDGIGVGALNTTEVFEAEAQDSAGNDADGRGTNQKLIFSQKYFVNVSTIGNKAVTISFLPQGNGVAASMWDATIIVEEEFGVINN